MSTELVNITINGQQFQVAKGARLIDACRENGFDIPSFCYYSDLALQASCRMCMVRIEKMPKLQTSCTMTCTEGMVVTTQSEEIEKAQRAMNEFLLANHPLDCPVCDRGGECELQEMTFDWGGLEERFTEQKNYYPEKYLSPMIANDQQRCILCKRCTRVCDEWMGEEAIEAGNRGVNTVIGTYMGWLDCSQCGNCIEVCPTGTLLDATYRHQTRPWELAQTISTCNFCSDGCQMSLGSRGGELMRVVARDRYVNGINGEFLCVKGRFAHPFVNHEDRIRTPLIRYKKGGKLIPATWDEAIRHVADRLDSIADAHGRDSIAVVGSPRLTNEALFTLHKFATELVGTENYTTTDAFNLTPFFRNLGAPLATHKDIRYAKTILLIGGEPEELQPLTGKQVRQAVRNGGAKLLIINSVPIRLVEQASVFVHVRPNTEEALLLSLADKDNDSVVAEKAGIEAGAIADIRRAIAETNGDLVVMFGELSAEAQVIAAQLQSLLGNDKARVLLHPLPLFNNSFGAHDMRMMERETSAEELLDAAGDTLRAMYVAGSFLPRQLAERHEALTRLDFLVVQELFPTETTKFADVVLPAASYAEVDGTFTNNDGLVQRVRQSIPPLNQAKPDWMITAQLAKELGMDWEFDMSASAVFREISEKVPAYTGMRYPLLKDETRPVQAQYEVGPHASAEVVQALRKRVEALPATGEKINITPDVGHELFKIATLTDKVPQFHLLAGGNPRPETTKISPLYQITLDANLQREEAVAGD